MTHRKQWVPNGESKRERERRSNHSLETTFLKKKNRGEPKSKKEDMNQRRQMHIFWTKRSLFRFKGRNERKKEWTRKEGWKERK